MPNMRGERAGMIRWGRGGSLAPAGAALDGVLEDACDLVDAMFSTVEQLYGVHLVHVTRRPDPETR